MKKQIKSVISICCAGVLGLSLVGCKDEDAEAVSYVSLDINPSIELTVDEDNKVLSVYAANEDGQVLLYGEESVIGMDVEKAVGKITDLAVELGYLNEENKVVGVTVSAGAKGDEELDAKLDAKIVATAEEAGLSVKVTADGSFSLNRKLAQVKAENPDNSAVQNVSSSKFKLALSVSETSGISIETAIEMDNEELLAMLSEAHSKIESYATTAYTRAKTLAEAAYDEAVGVLLDGVYSEYYVKNMFAHTDTYWYGGAYQMYKMSARGFEAVADTLSFVEDVANYPLAEAQVTAVAEAFDLTEEQLANLKNSDGEITLKSVEAYADKVFKNSEAGQELENWAAEVNASLNEAETIVKAEISKAAEKYQPQIEATVNATESVVTMLKSYVALLPEGMKAQLNEYVTNFEELVSELEVILEKGEITEEDIREYAKRMEEKAANILEKIEQDLTEEELEKIEDRKSEIEKTFTLAKKQMQDAIAKAETEAKARLAALKEQRKATV